MDNGKRILSTAKELFFRYGLKSVTVDDIARELGMSKKTIYESYSNKKEIIQKVTEQFMYERDLVHKELLSGATNAVEELMLLMKNMKSMFEAIDVRMVYDMQKYYPESWEVFLRYKEEVFLKEISVNLLRGIDEGVFRSDIDVDIIARMRLEQIQLSMDPKYFPADKFDLTEVNKQLLMQYINGLCTPKGMEIVNEFLNEKEQIK